MFAVISHCYLLSDEYIPAVAQPNIFDEPSDCCYSSMNLMGNSLDDYDQNQAFCVEPSHLEILQQKEYQKRHVSGSKKFTFINEPFTSHPSMMGWTHQPTSLVQGWPLSPPSSSILSTFNSSKSNLSKLSSAFKPLPISTAAVNSQSYYTQPEALPINDMGYHGSQTPPHSSLDINSGMASSISNQQREPQIQTSYEAKGILMFICFRYICNHFSLTEIL